MSIVKNYQKTSFISIIPLLVFVFTFLGFGIYLNDFYALPSPLAALAGIVVAFLIFKGNMEEKTKTFLKGCGERNILTMCIIYLLAGAFATVSKAAGSVDTIVNMGMTYISPQYFAAGIFVIASFLSFASGTSVGAIVALAPIVVELADKSGAHLGIVGAALLCGSMFGDNLSIISDTTIAATQSVSADIKDKFKANFKLALPAAILATLAFVYSGMSQEMATATSAVGDFHWWLVLPYLLVIALAVLGINVFVTLFIGLITAGIIGLSLGSFDFMTFAKKTYEGFTGMSEIFYLSLLTGGLAAMVEQAGGIRYILNSISKMISGKTSAMFGIGSLVSAANLCVANNTIAIIISGKIAKEVTHQYQLKPKNAASVLDIFACYIQGLIPYGAQILILISLSQFRIDYKDLFFHSYYLHLLMVFTIGFIVFNIKRLKD
ncbi:Na+/H+ antiporter NhaC family protein [Bergeyella porcorum]|uniref:Na+/H+ antiporter NhaC family protein n=1 Tax=Bergeyella porcorum TaxID=1735111 RepID=UPI0035EEC635